MFDINRGSLQAARICLGPELFKSILESTKKRCKGATAADKVLVFRAVGLRPKTKQLNTTTVSGLEYLFQLATIRQDTWKMLLATCAYLKTVKKEMSVTTFKNFQGCSDAMKRELLKLMLNGELLPRDMKRKADTMKALVKVHYNFL